MIRLLFIIPSLKKTGPINVVFNICLGIKKNYTNVKVDILSLNDGELYDAFDKLTDNLFIIKKTNLIKIKKIFNREYHIIHSHCVIPDMLNVLFGKSNKKNIVTTIHNYINIDYLNDYGFLKGSLISLVHKYSIRRINNVVSCSESVKNYLQSKFKIKSTTISNGVSAITKKHEHEHEHVHEQIKFIMLTTFNKRKNNEIAINGFILAGVPNSTLTILGEGALYLKIKEKYKNIKNIFFIGKKNNPQEYLMQSDVFLSSSIAEGLPLALLEAISCSNTYIVSNIDPHYEVYNKNLKSGIICNNSVEDFEKSIREISSLDLSILKKESLDLYLKNYTLEKMTTHYIELYKKILS